MLRLMIAKKLEAFEERYDYSMDYAREVLGLGVSVYKRFYDATQLSQYDGGLPADAHFAARLLGVQVGDCGPCVQLVVKMAEEANVSSTVLSAVLERRFEDLEPKVALCARFALALLERTSDLGHLREEVRAQFGAEGLVAIAYAVISSGMYPTLKYAVGHGEACSRVVVGQSVITFAKRIGQVA